MKTLIVSLLVYLSIANFQLLAQSNSRDIASVNFEYDKVKGIGHETVCTRRDPSDVIKVDDTYFVYYTKINGHYGGYWGTLWYATSNDEGYTWTEQGEILGLGNKGKFDSQATFTPNIIFAESKYYLYYTGVKPTPRNVDGKFENNSTTDITALGLAVSDSPAGPFTRTSEYPVLKISAEPDKFDSYRIDDASLLYRNGLYWLYYKGRSRIHGNDGPAHTQMGVAYSNKPEGPFVKLDRPILEGSHEVMIWPQGTGVAALASISSTIEYAADGITFTNTTTAAKVKNRPHAPGAYRPDLTNSVVIGEGLKWGIGMVHNGNEAYLIRYKLTEK